MQQTASATTVFGVSPWAAGFVGVMIALHLVALVRCVPMRGDGG